MKKLRIAVWHNLPSGGGKRQLYSHVKGLLERGHYVESWCPDSADQKFLPLSNLVKEHKVSLKQECDYNQTIKPFSTAKMMIRAIHEHCSQCGREINEGDFDVLFANGCSYLRTSPIAKYVNLPSVIYLNEPYRWFYEALPELPWVAKPDISELRLSLSAIKRQLKDLDKIRGIRFQAREELESALHFDLILANSIYSRECIMRAYNLESKVCYLGIDTDHYKPTNEPKGRFVISVGTIYHGKGVDRAIRAVGTIPERIRPDLVWVGNGAVATELVIYQSLARELGVKFIPKIHISDDEVISLLSRALVMIYTPRLEPFGLAPLEANSCGTAAIGISEGGVKETVKDSVNGFLTREDDPAALGALLTKFAEDMDFSLRMGRQARQHVEQSWNMALAIDNIEYWIGSIAEKDNKEVLNQLLSDPEALSRMAGKGDVKMALDYFTVSRNRVRVEGWAFIDDGKSSSEAEISFVVRNGSSARILKTTRKIRPDVTRYFGGRVNYDHTGFSLDEKITRADTCDYGVLIRRNEKISFAKIPN